jgi:antibiotic biosynthesis monooxygenase (ABM) superfamily enzyme
MTITSTTTTVRTSMPKPPSIHVRALITWIAIFPLVTVGAFALAPFASEWNPIARSFVLSLMVVPSAVYIVVPQLTRFYAKVHVIRTKDSNRNA